MAVLKFLQISSLIGKSFVFCREKYALFVQPDGELTNVAKTLK